MQVLQISRFARPSSSVCHVDSANQLSSALGDFSNLNKRYTHVNCLLGVVDNFVRNSDLSNSRTAQPPFRFKMHLFAWGVWDNTLNYASGSFSEKIKVE